MFTRYKESESVVAFVLYMCESYYYYSYNFSVDHDKRKPATGQGKLAMSQRSVQY